MPEITTARVALVISVLVALWNFWKYRQEGARVRVRLKSGLHYDDGALAQADTWASLGRRAAARGYGWNTETAVIEVENVGRTAVTISNVSLTFRSRPWWRQKRYSIAPLARDAPDATTSRTHRLEPFDSATFVYDFWVGLDAPRRGFEPPVRPLTVRAMAKVAGRTRPVLSSWRRRWLVEKGQLAFISELAEIGMLTYRRFVRHAHIDLDTRPFMDIACIPTAIDVREQFPLTGPAPTKKQLTAIIQSHYFGDINACVPLVASNLAEDLAPLYLQIPPTPEAVESPPAPLPAAESAQKL